jgi:RNA polymerase sigma factor (sigma-70 family)
MAPENDASSADYQNLLDGLRRKDRGAVRALTDRAYDRLRRLAAKILNESFPRVAARHDLDSVVSNFYLKLAKSLESVDLETPADFFRFAAYKIRLTLLDMVEADRKGEAAGGSAEAGFDAGATTFDPARLAAFTEFHNKVDDLPDDVKAVFVQHYYLGLTQAEIAEATGATPKAVSRLWQAAIGRLAKHLPF